MAKERAILAAGCFWGVQALLAELEGVEDSVVGYIGGDTKNPRYEDVCGGDTGHAEAVELSFDPQKITFEEILETFWRLHDPTTLNRQGADVGSQYRSAIFYCSEKQREIAEKSKAHYELEGLFKDPIVTEIVAAPLFFPAEDYHQNYFKKNNQAVCHLLREQ